MKKRRHWHNVSRHERKKLEARGATWADVKRTFDQPSWCNYGGALDGIGGCWSLVGGMIRSRKDCGACECAKASA